MQFDFHIIFNILSLFSCDVCVFACSLDSLRVKWLNFTSDLQTNISEIYIYIHTCKIYKYKYKLSNNYLQ